MSEESQEQQMFNDIQEALNPRTPLEQLLIEKLRQCGELVKDLPGDSVVEKVQAMKAKLDNLPKTENGVLWDGEFMPWISYTAIDGRQWIQAIRICKGPNGWWARAEGCATRFEKSFSTESAARAAAERAGKQDG